MFRQRRVIVPRSHGNTNRRFCRSLCLWWIPWWHEGIRWPRILLLYSPILGSLSFHTFVLSSALVRDKSTHAPRSYLQLLFRKHLPLSTPNPSTACALFVDSSLLHPLFLTIFISISFKSLTSLFVSNAEVVCSQCTGAFQSGSFGGGLVSFNHFAGSPTLKNTSYTGSESELEFNTLDRSISRLR